MPTTRLTFEELADLEPRLAALEQLVKLAAPAAGGDPDYMVFLTTVKPLVTSLVGWHRGWLDVRETLVAPPPRTYTVAELLAEPSGDVTYPRPHNEVEDYLRSSSAYDTVYDHLNKLLGE